MQKRQLIESIMQVNRTARAEWLTRFNVRSLKQYLDHLMHALEPRGGSSRWQRTGDTPVAITRSAA